jgi:hypothetical protein
MAFTSAINTSLPTGSEDASTIDNILREVRTQMKERFDSLTTGSEVDPMRLKAGALGSGYTIASPNISNPTFTGTLNGLAIPYSRIENSTSDNISNGILTPIINIGALPAGTYFLLARASCAIEGASSGNIFQLILSANTVGTIKEAYINPNTSGPVYHDIFVTAITAFASTSNVTASVLLQGSASTNRWVYGTDANKDTSITAIRLL